VGDPVMKIDRPKAEEEELKNKPAGRDTPGRGF
jgi:hypothetical protein